MINYVYSSVISFTNAEIPAVNNPNVTNMPKFFLFMIFISNILLLNFYL